MHVQEKLFLRLSITTPIRRGYHATANQRSAVRCRQFAWIRVPRLENGSRLQFSLRTGPSQPVTSIPKRTRPRANYYVSNAMIGLFPTPTRPDDCSRWPKACIGLATLKRSAEFEPRGCCNTSLAAKYPVFISVYLGGFGRRTANNWHHMQG